MTVAYLDLLNSGFCSSLQYIKPMNFQEEVRAHRDLDSFLAQASNLLDEKATTLDEVLRRMVTHMIEKGHGSCDVEEVMTSSFTDTGGKILMVSKTC